MGAYLIATVFAAVYHAEVVAHRVGEPFGTIVLAIAVTVIEVALVVSMMLSGNDHHDADASMLARDTVYAAVMIVCNGLVGACIFIGCMHYREQDFQLTGANLYLSVLHSLGIEQESFADSTGTLSNSSFGRV